MKLFISTDENEDQVFAKFMRAHKCYDLIPTSAKLVIFDTKLNVSTLETRHKHTNYTIEFCQVSYPVCREVLSIKTCFVTPP